MAHFYLPCIAAVIGWLTNYIAIKMLFHPQKPVNLGFVKIQGIFPKRQEALAQKIGFMVANDLLQVSELKEQLIGDDLTSKARGVVSEHLDAHLKNKISDAFPMMAMFINDNLIQQFKEMILKELDEIFPKLLDQLTEELESKFDVESIVAEKIKGFSFDKLESMLFSIMKKEFKFIELVGAVLGFLIGCIQLLMINFL